MATSPPSTTIKTRMAAGREESARKRHATEETVKIVPSPLQNEPKHQQDDELPKEAATAQKTNAEDPQWRSIDEALHPTPPLTLCTALSRGQGGDGKSAAMEMRQIELIYRAEGNANLVLALPQFKKVLRLPKTHPTPATRTTLASPRREDSSGSSSSRRRDGCLERSGDNDSEQQRQPKDGQLLGQQQRDEQQRGEQQLQQQPRQQHIEQQQNESEQEVKQQSTSSSVGIVNQNAKAAHSTAVGSLTMWEFAAYIDVLRGVVGPSYILDTQIVGIPHEKDRRWINDSIRPHRPAHRLAKEFCGQFGLLLPDATLLEEDTPALCVNSQSQRHSLVGGGGDTYAIEIKPKQGWLLPNNLTDIIHNKLATPTTITAVTVAATETTTAIGYATTNITTICGRPKVACRSDVVATKDTVAANQFKWDDAATTCSKSNGRFCRYCAMQFLKLKTGKISAMSSYCPMDLFSGRVDRMERALNALFACPQNNLRVFRNGKCVFGGDNMASPPPDTSTTSDATTTTDTGTTTIDGIFSGGAEERQPHEEQEAGSMAGEYSPLSPEMVKKLVIESLLKDYTRVAQNEREPAASLVATQTKDRPASGTNRLQGDDMETHLPPDCVLANVLRLQLLAKRNLDVMLAAGFAHNTAKSYTILRRMLATRLRHGDESRHFEASEEYLLGATALDCSIMLAFREIPSESSLLPPHGTASNVIVMPEAPGQRRRAFLSRVSMLDLDPKPDSHFSKYLQQSREAYQCALSGEQAHK